jgi:ATP-dependent DNA ligase
MVPDQDTATCKLERIVCKRRDAPYQSGWSKTWLKVKNPASPAMRWLEEVP